MSHEDTVIKLLTELNDKTDAIIQRNAQADVRIGVLQTAYDLHDKADKTNFDKIEKKLSRHEGYFWKSLVFLVVSLVGIIVGFFKVKQ